MLEVNAWRLKWLLVLIFDLILIKLIVVLLQLPLNLMAIKNGKCW